jgi:hypothetical protein
MAGDEGGSMTIHWQALTAEGRIEALKSKWELGISMGQLARRLGVTRSSIAGIYNRHRDKLPDHPLNRQTESLAKAAEARRQRLPKQPKPMKHPRVGSKLMPRPTRPTDPRALPVVAGPQGPGVPLDKLAPYQCKWAINEAERGEQHLFCRAPAPDGPYCAHHKARSTATEIGWGFK